MTQPRKILKFGGSSLSSSEGLERIRNIVSSENVAGRTPVIVASAFVGCTNLLFDLCVRASAGQDYKNALNDFSRLHRDAVKQNLDRETQEPTLNFVNQRLLELEDLLHGISLVKDVSPKTTDHIVAHGEILAAYILSAYLNQFIEPTTFLDARQVVATDATFGAAKPRFAETLAAIREYFNNRQGLVVVTGYIGRSPTHETTTLGRGGSDLTASLCAIALEAEAIQIWTTVDGVMTADPLKVSKAFTIPVLSYEEAMELSHFGTEILHPPAIQPARDAGIPIHIKNTLKPDSPGTTITDQTAAESLTNARQVVTGIASISDISLLRLEGSGMVGVAGVARRLFDALSRVGISVALISQASSEHSICFAIPRQVVDAAKHAVDAEFRLEIEARQLQPLTAGKQHSIIALVGSRMQNTPGISGKAFQALGKNGINVAAIAQGSSERNISIVVDAQDETKALGALHDAFFLSETKTVHLFLIGTGNVGRALLSQINQQQPRFLEDLLELRLVGLANSKTMAFNETGLQTDQPQEVLAEGEPYNVAAYVQRMNEMNLPNTVFIDCTASDDVASHYADILAASISIATPNKRANSGTCEQYRLLKQRAAKANVKYFYETTVGAGLPVIGTLGDLISSGDQIIRIEAVLSGTLSYLFNNFGPGTQFSEIVRRAKENGYTEPDPRDDLSGTDVARKLLVLAREIGMELELAEVEVESLIPPCCAEAESPAEFLDRLADADQEFEARRAKAEAEGKVLRYIGTVEDGAARVSLQAVSDTHPFYSLSGTDNIISFVTRRYSERPLVVKGPGAGTDVTAAGVLADIVRIASYLA